jgi:hypothetical protein
LGVIKGYRPPNIRSDEQTGYGQLYQRILDGYGFTAVSALTAQAEPAKERHKVFGGQFVPAVGAH